MSWESSNFTRKFGNSYSSGGIKGLSREPKFNFSKICIITNCWNFAKSYWSLNPIIPSGDMIIKLGWNAKGNKIYFLREKKVLFRYWKTWLHFVWKYRLFLKSLITMDGLHLQSNFCFHLWILYMIQTSAQSASQLKKKISMHTKTLFAHKNNSSQWLTNRIFNDIIPLW